METNNPVAYLWLIAKHLRGAKIPASQCEQLRRQLTLAHRELGLRATLEP